jgi:hypothetical protein
MRASAPRLHVTADMQRQAADALKATITDAEQRSA